METKIEKRSIENLMKGLEGGLIIREGLQRTPSHDSKKAIDILTSIYQNKYSGVLHFGVIDKDTLSILDGSSRLQDIQNLIEGVEGVAIKKEVFNSEKQCLETIKTPWKLLKEDEKKAFLNYEFPCVILSGVNNSETFVNLNSSTSLSAIQKNKGNLSEGVLNVIELFNNSAIIKNCLSDRQRQKDETIIVAFQFLSNVYGVYSASNKKLVDNVKATELLNFNFDRLEGLLNKFNNIDIDINKYCLVSLLSVLYNSPLELNNIPMFDNNIVFKIDTAGANSAPANESRLLKASKKLNNVLGVSVKTGRRIVKNETMGVEVEEVTPTSTADILEAIEN